MIDNEASNYRLTVGTYKGNAGNTLNHNSLSVRHNGICHFQHLAEIMIIGKLVIVPINIKLAGGLTDVILLI